MTVVAFGLSGAASQELPPTGAELTISTSDVSVAEGDSSKTDMNFTVTLSGSPSHEVRVSAEAKSRTATGGYGAGRDFIHYYRFRQVVFPANATGADLSQTVTVSVLGDTVVEEDETLILKLSNLRTNDPRVKFAGGKRKLKATGTIINDDSAPVITTQPAVATEIIVQAEPTPPQYQLQVSEPVRPSTPSGLTVQKDNDTAVISWSSGGSGVGGNCPSTGYLVRVYENSKLGHPEPVAKESEIITGATSWSVSSLSAGVWYTAEVYAFGSACGNYSANRATTRFLTSTSSAGTVDALSPNKLLAPNPVRSLQVNTSTSNQVTINWMKPLNGNSNIRCTYTNSGGNHANTTIGYKYYLENLNTGKMIADVFFTSSEASLSKVIDFSGENLGTGSRLRVTVFAVTYMACDNKWSTGNSFTWRI
ncbi:fibronectin type III domain-containing protein [Candidatus Poriferisocius sp.]|uniref:fibronectin type III domain-containing protein n=1 Tax=Candidatus Poriferisocius sp. TaxID=3101276 RepID=UPI003B01B2F4